MQINATTTPTDIDESALDDVTGGGIKLMVEFPATGGVQSEASTTSGHYTQMAWANTR